MNRPPDNLTASEKSWVFALAFALLLLGWISLKMVLPALPQLPEALGGTAGGVKFSVSLYLLCYACSAPVWGGFITAIGCRRSIFFSLGLTLCGTLLVIVSPSLTVYIIGRTLEGTGIGATSPICRTMLADVFKKKELVGRFGIVASTASAMPALAPLFGGYLMIWLGWRSIFAFFFLAVGIYLLIASRKLAETHIGRSARGKFSLGDLLKTYVSILRTTHFWGFALAYAALSGGVIGYYSALPFWYHVQLGIAPHIFSYLALPTVGMYIAGLIWARFLVKQRDLEEVFVLGMILALAAGLAAGACSLLGISGAAPIVVILSVFALGAGLVSPIANAGILSRLRPVAAPASALVVLGIFGSASLASAVTMNLSVKTGLASVAGYLGVLSLIALGAGWFWIWRPYRSGDSTLNAAPEIHQIH